MFDPHIPDGEGGPHPEAFSDRPGHRQPAIYIELLLSYRIIFAVRMITRNIGLIGGSEITVCKISSPIERSEQ